MKPLDCMPIYEDAELYDHEFGSRTHEIPFYTRHALRSGGPVLELACGTGRLTLPIAAAGVPVVGVDVAPAMIARARHKAAAAGLAIEWHIQDVRALALDRQFALAFIATNALQHLHDIDSVVACFARVRAHLAPGAAFIVDVFNPDLTKLIRGHEVSYLHKEIGLPDGRRVRVNARSEYDRGAQLLHFTLSYLCGSEVIHTKDVHMRCFFPEELLALCRLGGFDVGARFGDHEEQLFTGNSPQQILLCRARPS